MTTNTFFQRWFHHSPSLTALVLGALTIFSYAPFYIYPLNIIGLSGLFYLMLQAKTTRQRVKIAYCFGLGFFGFGVSWVYVSLHDFGGMPFWMAIPFTVLFCGFLALFHAAFAWGVSRLEANVLALPCLWVLGEWIRSWIFTGFPWLLVGYAHIPASPLANLAPITGVYGISFVSGIISVGLACYFLPEYRQHRHKLVLGFVFVWVSTSVLHVIQWTQPLGKPIAVALLQGNVPQELKWAPEAANDILKRYLRMANEANGHLIVMPESAMPMVWEDLPSETLKALDQLSKDKGLDILYGVIEAPSMSNNAMDDTYFNSMVSVKDGVRQRYRKVHLVPFGEFIPMKQWINFIYRDWLNMPLSDISRGEPYQAPMRLAGIRVGLNICYEDAFGEEIIQSLPAANLLVNASNMAWFGHSWAADQHLQMSQARALETGRIMLRATNTGATAVIQPDGEITAKLAYHQAGILEADVQPYAGSTPYSMTGNYPVIGILFALMAYLIWRRTRRN